MQRKEQVKHQQLMKTLVVVDLKLVQLHIQKQKVTHSNSLMYLVQVKLQTQDRYLQVVILKPMIQVIQIIQAMQ